VIPPIESHGGRVLQRLGDGLLAVFPTSTPGVKAGIEIQKRLHEYNSRAPERERIHVRVGLNSGMAMVEEANVFGDAVNTAARVQTLAEPGQILVSESTYREASGDLGTDLFWPVGPAALKGKLEKVVVLEVMWSPERARLRAAVQTSTDQARRVLHLDVSRTGARLKVATREVLGTEEAGVRQAEEMAYDEAAVGQTVQRIETILGGADRDGRIPKQNLEDLGGLGHLLWEQLLPAGARARLGTHLGDRPEYHVVVNDRTVSRAEFLAQFTTCDVVHVAGQAEYAGAGGGFAVADGGISVADLARLPGDATVPRLLFFAASEP